MNDETAVPRPDDTPVKPRSADAPAPDGEAGREESPATDQPAPSARVPRGRKRRASERFHRGRVSIGDLLGGTFRTYFRGLLLFSGILLIIQLPNVFLLENLVRSIAAEMAESGTSRVFIYFLGFVGVSLIGFVMTQIAVGTVVYGVFRRQRNEPAGIVRCFATVLKRLPQVAAMALMLVVCIFGPLVPGFIALAVLPALGVFVVLAGLVFCAIIYTALYLAPAAVVVERLGPVRSIGRSLQLTRGNRWRIFCLWFVLVLFMWAIGTLADVVVSSGGSAFGPDAYPWFVSVVRWGVAVFTGALNAVAVGVAYWQIKVKVEGMDADELAAVFD